MQAIARARLVSALLLSAFLLGALPQRLLADASVYGRLNAAVVYVDQARGAGTDGTQVKHFQGFAINDNKTARPWSGNPFITTPRGPSNRFGIMGSSDLGEGLAIQFKIEVGFSLTDNNNDLFNLTASEPLTLRNTYVGVNGDWGSLLLGRLDTPLKSSTAPLDLFINTLGDSASTIGFQNYRADKSIFYASPDLGGLRLTAAMLPGGGISFDGAPNSSADSLAEAISLSAVYRQGPLHASLAYETLSAALAEDSDQATDSWRKWRLGLGLLTWRDLTLTAMFERWDHAFWGRDHRADLWQLHVGYQVERLLFKAKVGANRQRGEYQVPASLCCDLVAEEAFGFQSWALGVDYNFSAKTRMFMVYSANPADPLVNAATGERADVLDWRGAQLGISLTF